MKQAGVYSIKNSINGKIYIGRAVRLGVRWTRHRWELERGHHRNAPLQADWNAFGPGAFAFEVIEIITADLADLEERLNDAEHRALSAIPYGSAYNLMEAGRQSLVASDDTRAKLSAQRKALWADPEYRARLSAAHKARHTDPEYAEKRAASIRAARGTSASRAKTSFQARLLWSDPEHRAKRTDQMESLWDDPDYRARQQASRKGAWAKLTPEQRQARIDAATAGRRKKNAPAA